VLSDILNVVWFREAPVVGKLITPMLDGIYYLPRKAWEFFLKITGRSGGPDSVNDSGGLIPNRYGGFYSLEESIAMRRADRAHQLRMAAENSKTEIS